MIFRKGDRVVAKVPVGTRGMRNVHGTVIYIFSNGNVSVEYDDNIGGHSGMGGRLGYCWDMNPGSIILEPQKKIPID